VGFLHSLEQQRRFNTPSKLELLASPAVGGS
jgi:hypothetical protein